MHVLFFGQQHQLGQVGVDVDAGVVGPVTRPRPGRTAQHIQFAEDLEKIGHSLLVSLSGQEGHDDELHAKQHEQITPFGVEAGHGETGSLCTVLTSKTHARLR